MNSSYTRMNDDTGPHSNLLLPGPRTTPFRPILRPARLRLACRRPFSNHRFNEKAIAIFASSWNPYAVREIVGQSCPAWMGPAYLCLTGSIAVLTPAAQAASVDSCRCMVVRLARKGAQAFLLQAAPPSALPNGNGRLIEASVLRPLRFRRGAKTNVREIRSSPGRHDAPLLQGS